MKLNNKGFAISTIMYMILVMAIIIITLTLSLLSNRKLILDKTKEEAKENIYDVIPRLPEEYQEVQYIESTGTQYINTGLIGRSGYTIEANIAFTKLSTEEYQYFAGYAYTGSNDRIYYIRVNYKTNELGYTYGSNNTNSARLKLIEPNKFYKIKSKMRSGSQEILLNGESLGSSSFGPLSYDLSNPKYIYMFISQYVDTTINGCNVKSKDVKWYDENSYLVRNFIPCYRKLDGVIGMYDLVEGKFYTNSGTGTFIKGNDIR